MLTRRIKMGTPKPQQLRITEAQAAEQLGITVPELRQIIHNQIADQSETSTFLTGGCFSRSDMVLLRFLVAEARSRAAPKPTG